jgi:hypothetical protein
MSGPSTEYGEGRLEHKPVQPSELITLTTSTLGRAALEHPLPGRFSISCVAPEAFSRVQALLAGRHSLENVQLNPFYLHESLTIFRLRVHPHMTICSRLNRFENRSRTKSWV